MRQGLSAKRCENGQDQLSQGVIVGNETPIVVIGAGMAGLGAAQHLAQAGASVTVIGARDRIGGRTWTSHLWPDVPVDVGASWVHCASRVIVTLPLGVLKSGRVRFAKLLGKRRQQAKDGLEMGPLDKCGLRFDRVFWPAAVDWITSSGPNTGFGANG